MKEDLHGTNGTRLVVKASLALPQVVYGAHGLVVWNVTGYENTEAAVLSPELAADQVGVLPAGHYDSP